MADSKIKKDMKNIRILIAEDNELSRDNLSELLKSYGYEVKGGLTEKDSHMSFL